MLSHQVVSVFIINDKNEILLINHKKLNAWLPPGGHVEHEKNELIHHAAIREVLEETGIHFKFISGGKGNMDKILGPLPLPSFIQLKDLGDHYHEDFIYVGLFVSNDIPKEDTEMRWFNKESINSINTFENVRRHLQIICNRYFI